MLVAETCLLLAVRERLRLDLSLEEHQCDIELDNQVPTIARDTYIAIVGAGMNPGPRMSSSGGVWDSVHSVRVTAYQTITNVPRDRRRNVFIDLLTGLNTTVDQIIRALHFNYTVTHDAFGRLVNTRAFGGKFPEPFRTFTPDPSPRAVTSGDVYDTEKTGNGDPVIALSRGVTFSGARFMMELN